MSIKDLRDIPVGGGADSLASRAAVVSGPYGAQNDNIVDVPMKEQRSLATVTAEIRAYQDAARRMAITYCIEVGRRLCEAKDMVAHGDWGRYLREELGFSQSRANDLMRIFEAYAADQMRLDGDNLKNQAFGNLSYTQALALLALPEEEREEFVTEHDMSKMSTRELQEELRRRGAPANEELKTNNEELRDPADCDLPDEEKMADRLSALQGELARANSRASDAEADRDRILRETEESREKADEAKRKAKEAAAELEKAKADLKKARDAEAEALRRLRAAKKDKSVPKEALEKLRKDAEEAAEARHKADSEELAAAKEKCVQAELAVDAAKREAKEAADRLAAVQKELALAAPELAVFRAQFERAQADLSALIESVAKLPEDKQAGARRGLAALLQRMHEKIGGGDNA